MENMQAEVNGIKHTINTEQPKDDQQNWLVFTNLKANSNSFSHSLLH